MVGVSLLMRGGTTPQKDPICIREHMPLNHQKYLSYNPEEFVHWAEGIGTHTL